MLRRVGRPGQTRSRFRHCAKPTSQLANESRAVIFRRGFVSGSPYGDRPSRALPGTANTVCRRPARAVLACVAVSRDRDSATPRRMRLGNAAALMAHGVQPNVHWTFGCRTHEASHPHRSAKQKRPARGRVCFGGERVRHIVSFANVQHCPSVSE